MRVLGGLVLCLAALVWWLTLGEGVSGLAPRPALAGAIAGAAPASSSGPLPPAAFSDPWALLSRAEAAGAAASGPLPAERQQALAWLEPAKDAAWCAQAAAAHAGNERVDELTLDLARQQVFERWIKFLRQRGDGRSLAGADYLRALASLGEASALDAEPLQRRALSSRDGLVLALATQLSCQPVQSSCQGLVARWLQLEPRNELALGWQLDLLPPDSFERLAALTRLADAQPDAGSQRVWAELFASLPRSGSAGLRQMAEQSTLEALHWAGSGSMSPSWAMACRKDKRPATAAACAKLAERIWQSEGASMMDKVQAVLVGKNLAGAELEWAQRYQTFKAVQAAGTRWQEAALTDLASAASCNGLAARHAWQQKLVHEGEWRVYSQLAAQPVLRNPAAMPLIDK